MVDPDLGDLSITQQCALLDLSRSGYYYRPVGTTDVDLACMSIMDAVYTKRPYFGARRLRDELNERGYPVGRKHVTTLMRRMGIEAIYPKKRLSLQNKENRVYPYLLRDLAIISPDQVWCSDITYIRMRHGYAYLVAVMDWFSRYVLSWELSMSLESGFCMMALESALEVSMPEIFNTDQGSQYTSEAFTSVLKKEEIRISMDGRGRVFDNIMIERLWRTVKYEEVYLKEYSHIFAARDSLSEYFEFYNDERRHSALNGQTPSVAYWKGPPGKPASRRRLAAAIPLRATPSAPLQPAPQTPGIHLI